MNLDQPIHIQLARFTGDLLRGDLGTDIFTGRSINAMVGDALPHTIALAFTGLGLAVLLGIPLGIYSATNPDSWMDRFTTLISVSLITIPSYVAGLFLLIIFSVELQILPAIGTGSMEDPVDYLMRLILPSVALAGTWIGYIARLVRTSLMEIMNENYIRTARAGGLSERLIRYKYALKNAIIPTIAVLGVGMGSLMGGAVFVEVVFSRSGMGTLIFNAISNRNFPVVRAGVLVIAFLFVLINFVVDLIYTYLDPRIQLDKVRG
jgi:peptide/nickel transport system permease protein